MNHCQLGDHESTTAVLLEGHSLGNRRGIVIGAGYFSDFHLEAWQRLDGVDIVCVCDTDKTKAEAAAAKFRVPQVSSDAASCLLDDDVDFVDIVTPPQTHFPLIKAAVARRLPVICQKPLAPNIATAHKIVALIARSGVPFMVHENFRWQPWYREIRRILDSRTIGERLHTLSMRSRMGDGWGQDAYFARQPYFRQMPRLLVHETGVHFVDTFRYLAGEIRSVSATLRTLNPLIAGEDAAVAHLHFQNGAIGIWDANRYNESLSTDPRYTFGELLVEADGGSLWLDSDGQITVKPLGQIPYKHNYVHQRRGFAGDCVFAAQQHFLHYLDGQSDCETSASEYLKTLEVVEALYDSAKSCCTEAVRSSNPRQRNQDCSPESTATRTTARGVETVASDPDCDSPARRIIDLSLPVDAELQNASVIPLKTIAADGWNATTLNLYSHCGTHMDAPRHFLHDGATLDQQDLSVCCGPARVVNLVPVKASQLITLEHFRKAVGSVCAGDRLLLRTDWHKQFGTPFYRDALPRISIEVAQWLVDQNVALIGVEPPSVADVNNIRELTEVHQTLFRGSVLIIEGLTNLDQLSQPIVEFIALPLKITGGDGCPVRAVAIEYG